MDHIQEPNTPETDKKLPHNLKFYTLIYYPAQYCFLANFYSIKITYTQIQLRKTTIIQRLPLDPVLITINKLQNGYHCMSGF